jgi:hypothetical protein
VHASHLAPSQAEFLLKGGPSTFSGSKDAYKEFPEDERSKPSLRG